MLVVLETLPPAERLPFVLHDTFAVPFEEIAPIVRRSPEATRQLGSRARRRLRDTPADRESRTAAEIEQQRAAGRTTALGTAFGTALGTAQGDGRAGRA